MEFVITGERCDQLVQQLLDGELHLKGRREWLEHLNATLRHHLEELLRQPGADQDPLVQRMAALAILTTLVLETVEL